MSASTLEIYLHTELTAAKAKIARMEKQVVGLNESILKTTAKVKELTDALANVAAAGGQPANFSLPPSLATPPHPGLTLPPAFIPAPPTPNQFPNGFIPGGV